MISAVAVTKDNVFMGHAALVYQYPEDRAPELTFVFVNVEYRGQGIFNRLNEFLMSTPKRRECAGIYAYAVANHIFTQKTMARYGINDCGILLATSPRSWKFKGIPGDPTQRISVILSFKYLAPPQALTLYPPAHHRDMIVRLYRHLGANHAWGQAPAAAALPETDSDILADVNASESCAEIFVRKYGRDVVREVRRRLRGFCLQQDRLCQSVPESGRPAHRGHDRRVREARVFLRRRAPVRAHWGYAHPPVSQQRRSGLRQDLGLLGHGQGAFGVHPRP